MKIASHKLNAFKSRILIMILILFVFALWKMKYKQKTYPLRFRKSVLQGMIRYDYESSESGGEKLIYFGLIMDHQSYGVDRDFNQFLDLLLAQKQKHVSLALLISSRAEFDNIASIIDRRQDPEFSRVVLLLDNAVSKLGRVERHNDAVQKVRRRTIALLRNTLVYSALEGEEFAVWLDADIIDITNGIVDKMIASKKDIITPGCQWGRGRGDYDQNAWKGKRLKPTAKQFEEIRNGQTFVPRPIRVGEGAVKYVLQMRSKGSDFVELDSVGGTMLFVKAEIFRKGICFPPYYVIGADWDLQEGYDGIETEGICYIAKTAGYKCWGMPNDSTYWF